MIINFLKYVFISLILIIIANCCGWDSSPACPACRQAGLTLRMTIEFCCGWDSSLPAYQAGLHSE